MEGDYDASPHGAPLVLFGLPSNADATVHGKIELPHLGSLILRHDPDAPLRGLKDYPRDTWPPVPSLAMISADVRPGATTPNQFVTT